MYRRILFALDAGRVAASAAVIVAELAQLPDAEVLVVNVRDVARSLRFLVAGSKAARSCARASSTIQS